MYNLERFRSSNHCERQLSTAVRLVEPIPIFSMRGKDVTPTVKVSILAQLHKSAVASNGKLAYGEKRRVALEYGVESFLELKRETLENIFYTWLAVMEHVMLHEGSNSYKMPRVKKQQIRNCIGGLPQSYICSIEAVTIGQVVLLNAEADDA